MKKMIRLTEQDLHRIVKESINKVLKETSIYPGYDSTTTQNIGMPTSTEPKRGMTTGPRDCGIGVPQEFKDRENVRRACASVNYRLGAIFPQDKYNVSPNPENESQIRVVLSMYALSGDRETAFRKRQQLYGILKSEGYELEETSSSNHELIFDFSNYTVIRKY